MRREETPHENIDRRFVPCVAGRPFQMQPEVCEGTTWAKVRIERSRFSIGDHVPHPIVLTEKGAHVLADQLLIQRKAGRKRVDLEPTDNSFSK